MVREAGTDVSHGSLLEGNGNDKFAANSFFSNRSCLARLAL